MSLCCTNQEYIGCFGSCESIETGLIATQTGDHIIQSFWLGNMQQQTVSITATNEIIFSNDFNECAAITFKIIQPDGVVFVDGINDCWTFSNLIKVLS